MPRIIKGFIDVFSRVAVVLVLSSVVFSTSLSLAQEDDDVARKDEQKFRSAEVEKDAPNNAYTKLKYDDSEQAAQRRVILGEILMSVSATAQKMKDLTDRIYVLNTGPKLIELWYEKYGAELPVHEFLKGAKAIRSLLQGEIPNVSKTAADSDQRIFEFTRALDSTLHQKAENLNRAILKAICGKDDTNTQYRDSYKRYEAYMNTRTQERKLWELEAEAYFREYKTTDNIAKLLFENLKSEVSPASKRRRLRISGLLMAPHYSGIEDRDEREHFQRRAERLVELWYVHYGQNVSGDAFDDSADYLHEVLDGDIYGDQKPQKMEAVKLFYDYLIGPKDRIPPRVGEYLSGKNAVERKQLKLLRDQQR